MSRFTEHVAEWKDCTACPLHKTRKHTVFARGQIPADVLLVGEAPGPSEDAIGVPFIGPAGRELDRWIKHALGENELRICFTNLICCIPKDVMEGGKFTAPPKESVKACSPRLTEFVEMVNPKLVILVGRESAKAWQNLGSPIKTEEIVHPAAVLRATGAAAASRSLMIKNAIVTLRDAFEEL